MWQRFPTACGLAAIIVIAFAFTPAQAFEPDDFDALLQSGTVSVVR